MILHIVVTETNDVALPLGFIEVLLLKIGKKDVHFLMRSPSVDIDRYHVLKWIIHSSYFITSHHIISRHITSHHITSHHITSHHITSRHLESCVNFFNIRNSKLRISSGTSRIQFSSKNVTRLERTNDFL